MSGLILATGVAGSFAGHVISALVAGGATVRAKIHGPKAVASGLEEGVGGLVVADLKVRMASTRLDGVDSVFNLAPAFFSNKGRTVASR